MRIAVGQIFQESNTFSPMPTTLETFESVHLWRGEQLLAAFKGARVEIPAFLAVLRRAGVEPVPLVAASALAGGVVTRAAFENLMHEVETRLTQGGALDAVLLALHGAMCVEDEPDAEGEIIERVANYCPQARRSASRSTCTVISRRECLSQMSSSSLTASIRTSICTRPARGSRR